MAEFDNKSSSIPLSTTTVIVSESIAVEQHGAPPKLVAAETVSENDLTQLRNKLILAFNQGRLGDTLADTVVDPKGKEALIALKGDSRLSILSGDFINLKIRVSLQIHEERQQAYRSYKDKEVTTKATTTSTEQGIKNDGGVLSLTKNDEDITKKIVKPEPLASSPLSVDDDKPTGKIGRNNPSGRQRTHRYSVPIPPSDTNSSPTTSILGHSPDPKKGTTSCFSQMGYTQQAALKFSLPIETLPVPSNNQIEETGKDKSPKLVAIDGGRKWSEGSVSNFVNPELKIVRSSGPALVITQPSEPKMIEQPPTQELQTLPSMNLTARVSKYVEEQIRSGKAIAAVPGAIVAGYSQYRTSKAKGDGVVLSVLKADLAAVTTFGTSIAPDAIKASASVAIEYLDRGTTISTKGKTVLTILNRAGAKLGLGTEAASRGAGYMGRGGKFLASRSLTVVGAAQDSWKIVKLGMEKDKIEASNLGATEKAKKIADINKQEIVVAGQVGGVALASGLAVSAVTVVAVAISAPAWVPLVVGAVASLAVAGAGAKIGAWLGAKIGGALLGPA